MRVAPALLIGILAAGCDSAAPYHTHIGEIAGPDAIAEPAARGAARWQVQHAGDQTLRALVCSGKGAVAVGDAGTVVRIDDTGSPVADRPLAVDLAAVAIVDGATVVGGGEAVWRRAGGSWARTALPQPNVHVLSLAVTSAGGLVVAGVLDRPDGSVGWVAEEIDGGFRERVLDWTPAVFQAVSLRSGEVLLAIDSTPVFLSRRETLVQLLPAQDVHPRILAISEAGRGLVAAGVDTAWSIAGGRLVRELRQYHLRLTGVAALPSDGAVAVGRTEPPGGRAGGVAWARGADGTWQRELLVADEALLAVAHCGGRVIAVGERGLVATRR